GFTPASTLGSLTAADGSGSLSSVPRYRLGNKVVFPADDGEHGVELWVTDGTTGGTTLLSDLSPGLNSSTPTDLLVVGAKLFFKADDGVHGRELWVTDGTPAG